MRLTRMVAPENEKVISRIYAALGHPLRREIIKALGEKKQVGFTDLKSTLKVGVGTLYYNLDLLEKLVIQDENKKYTLTPKGQIAYDLLIQSDDKISSRGVEDKRTGWFNATSRILFAHELFNYLYASTKLSFPSALTVILYGAWITYQSELLPLIFVYSDKPTVQPGLLPVFFLSGWLLINIVGNLIPWMLYHRPLRDGADRLLVGSCYMFLPSLIFPTIWTVSRLLHLSLGPIEAQLILVVSAGYSLCLLTEAVSMAKGLRIEKAALVTLIILYLTLALAFILR